MPTPSSDHPPNQPSPSPFGPSTCPDDLQLSQRTVWPPVEDADEHDSDMRVRRAVADRALHSTSPNNVASSVNGGSSEDQPTTESSTSAEPSSRATTMSPRPQTGSPALVSPASNGHEGESVKLVAKEDDENVDGALSTDPSSHAETRRRPRHFERNQTREAYSPASPASEDESYAPSMGSRYSNLRTVPTSPSSYLRPGSKFHGTQQSERQVYDVQVEIKHVDLRESFLCGYLRIQGLTEDHPTLTTYFEGEIIGDKYSFFTKHDDWGANSKVDLNHWAKFPAFRPFLKHARKGPVSIPDLCQRETIFMRWKEHFLVPDHRVRTITGASFEGFYYICFNQLKGEVNGIYFHSKSEKFQQLELKHVPDRGCFSAVEFR